MFMFGDLDAYSMVTQHLAWPALRAFRFMIKLGRGFAASHRDLMNIVLHNWRTLSSAISKERQYYRQYLCVNDAGFLLVKVTKY